MGTRSNNKNAQEILFRKTRRAILTLLLGKAEESFYLREIVRLTDTGLGAVQRELKLLAEAGIIIRTERGNQVYFQANRSSPGLNELQELLTKLGKSQKSTDSDQNFSSQLSRRFNVPQSSLAEFCRKYHIQKLSLFGSVLRKDFNRNSDIDVLVEFEAGKTPGFLKLADMEFELSAMLDGRKVDIRTSQDLSRYFRDKVVKEAKVQYGANR